MQNLSIPFSLFIMIFSSLSYSSTFINGNKWHEMSMLEKQGYVMGVYDAYTTAGLHSKVENGFITECMPQSVTNTQLVKIVEKYLKENPESLHYNMDALVSGAISKTFPCTEDNAKNRNP